MRVSAARFFSTGLLLPGLVLVAACVGSTGAGSSSNGSGGASAASGGATVSQGSGGAGSGGRTGGNASGGAGVDAGVLGSGGAPAGRDASTGSSGGTVGGTGGSGAGTGGAAGGSVPGSVPFKGVALGESNTTCPDIATLSLSWYYNWSTRTSCRGAEFVPMIWGHANEDVAGEIATIAAAGYKTVLGFNEPMQPNQSPYTVDQALALWPQMTANPALRVGSPATAANAAGQTWFTSFMTQATQQNLRIDFIALHWYGWNAGSCDANASQLEGYINWAESHWPNKPIWITEWGCLNVSAPTADGVKAFYDGALKVFAKPTHHIERYGWFLSRNSDNTALISNAGVVSPLGTDYAAAPTFK